MSRDFFVVDELIVARMTAGADVVADIGVIFSSGYPEESVDVEMDTLPAPLTKENDTLLGFLPDALEFRDGRLRTCGSRSEAAQYTIIWSGLFDRKEMPRYFWRLIHTPGPAREYECDTHLGKAQLFIGLCIRLDMLAKLGEYDVMLRELQAIYSRYVL